ncbi:hypothetical protein AY601_1470 [Pedobacter cryoconitis]|uniref:Rhamnogalacturonase A/B/Epimerase-like pectate lyase domain-containing protein n=1 Tax=Pedobacter cryoconitis TaxID=188932 RepID=A0A127VAZ0_9SPHI|nr:glycosyl hydrolase family 28-related protein [Pedobacter cryoconitis]AMP98387.1 hypothetical protein AY601_1470 [Pedobacter cryoconitis]
MPTYTNELNVEKVILDKLNSLKTISNILDQYTGELVTFNETTEITNDLELDGVIYVKFGDDYFKRNFTGSINIKWFGARGNGIHDDYEAIQGAINYAQKQGISLFIPQGIFKTSGTLRITLRIHIYGEGMWQSQIIYSGNDSAIRIIPPTDRTSNTGTYFHDFMVKPQIGGGGKYGIEVYLGINAYFSNWEFNRIFVGDFGNFGIRLDNSSRNVDGFFAFTIRRCWIQNGLNGDSVGDSITISENTITGNRILSPGILFSGIGGARQIIIRENNITTQHGAIALLAMEQTQVCFNQLEHGAGSDYLGIYQSQLYLADCIYCVIQGNTISPARSVGSITSDYAIYLSGTSIGNIITQNDMSVGAEGKYIGFGISSKRNILKTDNAYYGTLNSEVETLGVDNLGIDNYGVEVSLTLLANWIPYDSTSEVSAKKIDSGLVVLRGAIKDGIQTLGTTIFILPQLFRPVREKRFQVTNFNTGTFSSATLLIRPTGEVNILAINGSTLLQIDGVSYTTN